MRFDPQSLIGGQSALQIRKFFRKISDTPSWDSTLVQAEFSLREEEARRLLRALMRAGVIQRIPAKGEKAWILSQLGQSFAIAKVSERITRTTAERALGQLMERVQKVNQDDYFVAQVTGVILFGSMLRLEVDKLGDVDIAVQIEAKERSIERFRQLNI